MVFWPINSGRPPQKFPLVIAGFRVTLVVLFMKTDIHPKYVDAEIRCACGNVIKTRSTKPTVIVGICNVCHPFYTGQQKFVDTAGRVDKFQQRLAKTQAAQAAVPPRRKRKFSCLCPFIRPPLRLSRIAGGCLFPPS